MALSLALIILLGLIFNKTFDRINLPGLLGMLILGIIIGPNGLDFISEEILLISPDLRKIALIIILLRAGLGISKENIKKVGIPAVKMSCIPVIFEGSAVALVAHYLLNLPFIEAGILGFVIAAVSPAVIVPEMLKLMEKGIGMAKGIPTLILAAASVDDVFAITLFTAFLNLYGGENINIFRQMVDIPLSVAIGIASGAILAIIIIWLFKKYSMRDTKKVLVLLSVAIVLVGIEDFVHRYIPLAALLGVMAMGFVLLEKSPEVAKRMSSKFNKIWVFAQLLLFVLVGAEVNIQVAIQSGLIGIFVILVGLAARSIGVLISLRGTNLIFKEKLFCVISFIPKATVQAAIGAVPLLAGVPSGEIILALAVLSIIITAPIGALGIQYTSEKWLEISDSTE